MKDYQTTARRAGTAGRTTAKRVKKDAGRAVEEAALVLPETVSVVVGDLAGQLEEGLLAFAVGAGLKVVQSMMDHEVEILAGPKGRHDPDRVAVRHGRDDGLVTLGGRQVPISRPRVRSADRTSEVALSTYDCFASTELLGRMAMEKMLAKISTRRYGSGLEPVGVAVEARSRGTSRSAVSRRFVAATETALSELMAADLTGLDLVALMVDGVNFAGHCCVVAVGIDIDGVKHPLGVVEGDTENSTLVTGLLVGLRDRGLDVSRPILCVLDGAKALAVAVKAVFDHPVIARCQLHKIRNVKRHLPDKVARIVERRMRAAYRNPDPLAGQGDLEALAKELDHSHPGAAGSLREGLAETFTVARLRVPPTLARTLRSTNPVESMIEICRDHSANVKRWESGTMALRWCAAGLAEAKKQFRRVNGHMHLRALRAALDEHARVTVTPPSYASEQEAAA
ncbi:MAG TPA: IS256 family transposase [Acidimicrobiales bacterium]|nr:IS256 family transposase [Acidimicrobiales bacterium]